MFKIVIVDESPARTAILLEGLRAAAVRAAIANGIGDVEGIGVALRAGTNCGSCVPELKRMLSHESLARAV
ncbi:MAG TPA: (2Fe-2S)-binding protein [Xanthobacteraceae bacterium]|nr:(2Fe-2S)-binding protein [Xanthobacteraceae bacterium]